MHFFLYQKEKSSKKEVDQRAVGWLSSVGAVYRKAGAALRKRLRYAQNCSLGARVLRRSPFFGELPSYGGFSFGAPTGFQRPQKPILVPPFAVKLSFFRCSTEFSLSSSQKPIGGKIRRWEYSKPPRGTHLLPYARTSHESYSQCVGCVVRVMRSGTHPRHQIETTCS